MCLYARSKSVQVDPINSQQRRAFFCHFTNIVPSFISHSKRNIDFDKIVKYSRARAPQLYYTIRNIFALEVRLTARALSLSLWAGARANTLGNVKFTPQRRQLTLHVAREMRVPVDGWVGCGCAASALCRQDYIHVCLYICVRVYVCISYVCIYLAVSSMLPAGIVKLWIGCAAASTILYVPRERETASNTRARTIVYSHTRYEGKRDTRETRERDRERESKSGLQRYAAQCINR